jgi:microcystin-dependent protein
MADDDTRWTAEAVSAAKLNALGLFSFTNLAAFPSSSMEVGLKGIAEDSGGIYQNTGTFATPTWTLMNIGVPVGTLTMWIGTEASVASSWKICDGTAISRTTYASLFAICGTEYGVGDGSTTFNLPDFQTNNVFPRGATDDAGRGTTGGESTHLLTGAESGTTAHTHVITDPGHTHSYTRPYVTGYGSGSGGGSPPSGATTGSSTTGISINNSSAADAGSAHENKPPYVDVHFIVKVL